MTGPRRHSALSVAILLLFTFPSLACEARVRAQTEGPVFAQPTPDLTMDAVIRGLVPVAVLTATPTLGTARTPVAAPVSAGSSIAQPTATVSSPTPARSPAPLQASATPSAAVQTARPAQNDRPSQPQGTAPPVSTRGPGNAARPDPTAAGLLPTPGAAALPLTPAPARISATPRPEPHASDP